MSICAVVNGVLAYDPVERTSGKGGAFVTATVNVATGAGQIFVSVIAFDAEVVAELGAARKGMPVALAGHLTLRQYASRDGEERQALSLLTTALMRPAERRTKREREKVSAIAKPAVASSTAPTKAGTIEELEDDIPWGAAS